MRNAAIVGGSGFIESEIVSVLLAVPYNVKVSTTDISKKENYQHLMELEGSEHLHVCELDSERKPELENFITNCDLIIFTNPSDI